MRRLNDGSIGLLEDGREELHLEDNVRDTIDVDTVSDVVAVRDTEWKSGE